jgi:CO/xanthine dehydrogenase FAD-binding subunit
MEIDMLNLGIYLELADDYETVAAVRLAMGSVGPVTYRARSTEEKLTGMRFGDEFIAAAAAGVKDEATPIDDARASADYRNRVIGVLARRGLLACREQIEKGRVLA